MFSATKIRLYPTADQERILAVQFGCVRFVWNKALGLKQAAWQERKESLSIHTIITMIPEWKRNEHPWLKEADSQAFQSSLRHLDAAYQGFFKRSGGYPRFKKKTAARQSFQYPQRVTVAENQIHLPKVGTVKAVVHRPIHGKIKTVTVSRESSGKYYASILAEDGLSSIEPLQHIDGEQVLGIDLGLIHPVVDHHGRKEQNPRFLSGALPNLRRKQRNLSRKIEAAQRRFEAAKASHGEASSFRLRDFFGSNVAKDRKRVARAHERVRNARNDWQHKLSRRMADENQVVVAEDLNIRGMTKNRRLSRAISDVGWNGLLIKTGYKLQRKGGRLVKIDRWHPSSKRCSCCGTVKDRLVLSERFWVCQECGTTHDRDRNAAENIRAAGLVQLKAEGLSVSAHGGRVSPVPSAPAAACEVGSSGF